MQNISLNSEESLHILKALSQIDGVLFTLNDVPDAAFVVLEAASELIESKILKKNENN